MEFMQLNEYWHQAKKIIAKEGAFNLLSDDDAIADVAYKMMRADETWDAEKSDRTTWRYTQAKYAIWNFLNKRRQDKHRNHLSLDSVCEYRDVERPLKNFLADRHEKDMITQYEDICKTAHKILNNDDANCFSLYYQKGWTLQAIADQRSCSRERVRQKLERIRKKLKQCMSK